MVKNIHARGYGVRLEKLRFQGGGLGPKCALESFFLDLVMKNPIFGMSDKNVKD
jgi:hypothetical protein